MRCESGPNRGLVQLRDPLGVPGNSIDSSSDASRRPRRSRRWTFRPNLSTLSVALVDMQVSDDVGLVDQLDRTVDIQDAKPVHHSVMAQMMSTTATTGSAASPPAMNTTPPMPATVITVAVT